MARLRILGLLAFAAAQLYQAPEAAVITGHVRDLNGRPVAGVTVHALVATSASGRVSLQITDRNKQISTTSDNTGAYRLSVWAGRYAIAVSQRQPDPVYPTTFLPASRTASEASVLSVENGVVHRDADVTLTPCRFATVSGAIAGADAGPKVTVELERDEPGFARSDLDNRKTVTTAEGKFEFTDVAPGRYRLRVVRLMATPGTRVISHSIDGLRVSAPPPEAWTARLPNAAGAATSWANLPIEVTDEAKAIDNVSVVLQPGLRVAGQFVFDSPIAEAAARDRLEKSQISLVAVDDGGREMPVGRVQSNGTFTLPSVPPGRYFLNPVFFPNVSVRGTERSIEIDWQPKSILTGGRDVYGRVFELAGDLWNVTITMTSAPRATLASTVRGPDGTPKRDVSVYVFPKDRGLDPIVWGSLSVWLHHRSTDVDGKAKFELMPDVDYSVIAIEGPRDEFWTDPESLAALALQAVTVRVGSGATRQLELIARPRR